MDLQVLFKAFWLILLAELGDKTQLATLCFAATSQSRWSVFVGAAAALVLTSLVAVLMGYGIMKIVPSQYLRYAAGVLFIALGTIMLALELVSGLVDFFFPRLCLVCMERLGEDEEVICDGCRKEMPEIAKPVCPVCGAGARKLSAKKCYDCPKPPTFFDRARARYQYGGILPEAIQKMKYKKRIEAIEVFGKLLFLYWKQEMDDKPVDCIIPVPLHASRERHRGFNQSEMIAEVLTKYSGVPTVVDVLLRTRPTKTQTGLLPEERRKNVEGAFAVSYPPVVKDKHILLIDDVYTTGSTANECARMLKDAGCTSVTVLTLARA
jgi:competence protein ComFC